MSRIKNRGITLVALVITIIILLILAGITISQLTGSGLFEKARLAEQRAKEAQAKEKLNISLIDLQSRKIADKNYNESEYIDNYLLKEQMVVAGEVIVVDGWKFQIDRKNLKIINSLGEGTESSQIDLTVYVENASDYTKATIKIEINTDSKIGSIQINGENVDIPEKTEEKYIINKEIFENGKYVILIKDNKGEYKTANVDVTEISENMEIRKVEELVSFRDKVNKGATYEGKTIKLLNDLDLSTICGENIGSWQLIGTETTEFKGTFDGNYNEIKNLYINDGSYQYGGLFRGNNGTIQNIYLSNVNIYIDSTNAATSATAGNTIGAIAAVNAGNIINCGVKSGSIININTKAATILYRVHKAGGIAGSNEINGKIYNCYNKSNISVTNTTSYSSSSAPHNMVGGIAGFSNNNTEINNCYNLGKVEGYNASSAMIGGIVGRAYGVKITNSYNPKEVLGTCSRSKYIGKGRNIRRRIYITRNFNNYKFLLYDSKYIFVCY